MEGCLPTVSKLSAVNFRATSHSKEIHVWRQKKNIDDLRLGGVITSKFQWRFRRFKLFLEISVSDLLVVMLLIFARKNICRPFTDRYNIPYVASF